MDNKEKAIAIVRDLETQGFDSQYLTNMIEKTLNRLDAPEPKKWEPRGGDWYIDFENDVANGRSGRSCNGARLAGREYPTREEAERAVSLHRKLDRLVNWLVEHVHESDFADIISLTRCNKDELVVLIACPQATISRLINSVNSGEVEL